MSAPIYTSQASAAPIAVDAVTPNTTAPNDLRTFTGATGKDTDPTALYAVAVAGAITLQLWGYFSSLKRWAKIGAATACAEDTVTALPTPPVGLPVMYAQVTVNAACTQYAIGCLGGR
jgi:hypothetical protein